MKNKDALVILTPAFPKDESDSNWIPSHQLLVKALKHNYPDLHIVVCSFLYPDNVSTYSWNGVQVVSFDGNHRRKWKRLFLWRDIWQELRKIRRQYHLVGILSFWCGETALVGAYFGRRYGIRHRCWISGQDAQKGNKWVWMIRPRAEELVAMSTFLQHTFHRHYGINPAFVIPNGIDTGMFQPVASDERDLDILAVGSLGALKRYHLLVPVIAALKEKYPAVSARHFGNGPEKAALQTLIDDAGLKGNVHLMGEQPHREVLKVMQRTKILLHTSAYEGFSTVCLEALYAGAHVISFCDPIDKKAPQWHFVKNVEEMITVADAILQQPGTEYTSTLLYSMDDIARSVMQLFYEREII